MNLNLDDHSGSSRAVLDAAFGSDSRIGAFDRLTGLTDVIAEAAYGDQLAYRSLGGASEVARAVAKLASDSEITSQAICGMGIHAARADRAIREAMFNPIMQAERDLARAYEPIREILELHRQAEALKAYKQANEPANVFYDHSHALKSGMNIHKTIAEQSVKSALHSQIEQMRSCFDIPDQWRNLGMASQWISKEKKLLDRFCDVASPDLRIGASGYFNGIWARQELTARTYFEAIRAEEEIANTFSQINFGSTDLYGDRSRCDALSGLSFPDFSHGLNETQDRRPRAQRPYFANRNLYQRATNVGGAIEAVLRDAINEMLVDEFGVEWISEQLPQNTIKSLVKKMESESGHDDCVSLYEYLSLGEVASLIKRQDLWDACIGELFTAPLEEVIAFLDELTTRNSATHRRSNFRETQMREFLVAARFFANELQDDDLLQVIDEAEECAIVPLVLH